ncbi:RsmB/NOP family class I SAM-dependent RNA methyltransferase [Jannaschia donghaensis]|uniref:Ribosomal RNA small subunit methyltransferase B n=1 Tax=Jannaschia donghaensis TaxID=420998 RepID=A0A0M6YN43_9RHOB|nr:RsmB/NOP family class I SAM-dependent RNA methyltransferase [Jannaschia donghaensis]CTQ50446.1 Ribosomal RNA small subunit methyltransferase B [Jannaschia donghaensis]
MTPGARVQAAIEVLDIVLSGVAAERALTTWGRSSRYAGSKDRAAVRDHVFDALRRLRTGAWAGGIAHMPKECDARAVMAGVLLGQGADLGALFSGQGHAPAPLEEVSPPDGTLSRAAQLDISDWLLEIFERDLGENADPVLTALRDRAPVFLRANTARISRDALQTVLADEGVETVLDDTAPTALRLTGPARGLTNLPSFQDGLWELQDAGSQALVARLPDMEGARVLDLCAGGGGKALAMAARGAASVFAHDVDAARMRDIPMRSARADVEITQLSTPEDVAPFDAVVVDVPCSGSGSWRRAPDAKWRLTQGRLTELTVLQDEILRRAIALVRPGGWIGYMTCSVLACENAEIADRVVASDPDITLEDRWSCLPTAGGCDGFHLSVLRHG